jgi:DNA-directed RNA polymerase specialized sigma24 family protein
MPCRRRGCELQRADAEEIDNLEGWLTTVVARICLNILRDRRSHAAEPLDAFVPEPIISTDARDDPEHEALLADAVGIALQVVLDALNPAERLAFTVVGDRAVTIDIFNDRELVPRLVRSGG